MNKEKIYLKHKYTDDILTINSFKNGAIKFKRQSHNELINSNVDINTHYTFMGALTSDDFHILTDDSFSEEELHTILRLTRHNACNLDIMEKIAQKCADMLLNRKYINN